MADFAAEWESDPQIAAEMARARTRFVASLDGPENLRALRLKAGLSQALLAERADTTQSHVAHIESGAKDPQTDMIERIARALKVAPERVFAAVRVQRGRRS